MANYLQGPCSAQYASLSNEDFVADYSESATVSHPAMANSGRPSIILRTDHG